MIKFIELIDIYGEIRYINPTHVLEIVKQDDNKWKIVFANKSVFISVYFTDHNIDKLLNIDIKPQLLNE